MLLGCSAASSENLFLWTRIASAQNNYGIIVNNIGMRPVITHLQRTLLQPLSEVLFPTQAAGGFDGHHSFMVQYKAKQDLGLDMHTDDCTHAGA